MLPRKEQDRTPETDLNEIEISDSPNNESKVTVIKMFTKVRRTMHGQSENFNKEIENT